MPTQGTPPLHSPLSLLPFPPLPYGQNIRMLFISVFGVLTMISRRASSELCSTHAGLLLGAIPIPHALIPILIVAVGGAFWHAGRGLDLWARPPLVGLGLDYKNVPGIPVNTGSIFFLRSVLAKPVHSLA